MIKGSLSCFKKLWIENRTSHTSVSTLIYTFKCHPVLCTRATNKVKRTSNTCACTARRRTNGGMKMYGLRAGPIGWLAAVPTHAWIPHYPQPSLWTGSSQSIISGSSPLPGKTRSQWIKCEHSYAVNAAIALWTIAIGVNGQCLSAIG